MRLAHLSDPHLLSLGGSSVLDFANKRWIGGLNLIASRARDHSPTVFDSMVDDIGSQSVDHVLCTGDITNVALPSEFAFARARFDRLGALGLDPDRVTVLPGNHDTYVAAGVGLFRDHFAPYFAADADWCHDDGDPDPWPIVRVRGELAIIGMSSAVPTPWFTAYGRVGSRQLERLGRVLADARLADKRRVVAIHHPVVGRDARHRRHGLHDHAQLGAVISERGADLVLHGHEHRDLYHELAVPGGTVAVRGIQSATYVPRRRAQLVARYRIYDFATNPGESLRMWDGDGRFVDDPAPPHRTS